MTLFGIAASLVILSALLGISIYGILAIARFNTRRPFVPTPLRAQRKLLEISNLAPNQVVYDLGSGSGSLLRRLDRKYRAIPLRLIGIENDVIPYVLSKLLNTLTQSRVIIRRENYFETDLHDADFIYCYLSRGTMQRLGEKFRRECRLGTNVASFGFEMPGFHPLKTFPGIAGTNLFIYEI